MGYARAGKYILHKPMEIPAANIELFIFPALKSLENGVFARMTAVFELFERLVGDGREAFAHPAGPFTEGCCGVPVALFGIHLVEADHNTGLLDVAEFVVDGGAEHLHRRGTVHIRVH